MGTGRWTIARRCAGAGRMGCGLRGGLNEPSVLSAVLLLEGTALAAPVRRGRVEVSSAAGTVLFTGYLTTEPIGVYAGLASEGAVYRLAVRAVSDEWVLDKQAGLTRVGMGLNEPSGTVLDGLVGRLGAGGSGISANLAGDGRPIGVFEAKPDAAWSVNAGALAGAAYGAYRVLSGAVDAGDGGRDESCVRGWGWVFEPRLAEDRSGQGAGERCDGERGRWSRWCTGTSCSKGMGRPAIFELTGQTDAVNGGHVVLIDDDFSQGAIDPSTWAVTDAGSYLGLGGGGFTMRGGTGQDGQTTLTAIDPVELGGTVVIELDTVELSGDERRGAGRIVSGRDGRGRDALRDSMCGRPLGMR